jgi:hypothetical protein
VRSHGSAASIAPNTIHTGTDRVGLDDAQPGHHRPDRRRRQNSHLDDAIAATTLQLSDDEIAALEEPYQQRTAAPSAFS